MAKTEVRCLDEECDVEWYDGNEHKTCPECGGVNAV